MMSEGKQFFIIGTCGEYSDRIVWPACVVQDEATAQAVVVRFQAECRALMAERKRLKIDDFDDNFAEVKSRLLKLLPDPSFESRNAAEPELMDRMICYSSNEDWSYYYVEVSGAPDLAPPLTDARVALAA